MRRTLAAFGEWGIIFHELPYAAQQDSGAACRNHGDLRMKLTAQQVAGNTWCIVQPRAMVPYYQLNKREIILLDSGCMLHGELEEWLERQGAARARHPQHP